VRATEGTLEPAGLSNRIPQLVERMGSESDSAASNVTLESLAALATMVNAKEVQP
jgi:hypothetical protein